MKPKNSRYVNDVDDLIQRTPLNVVLNHYGLPLSDESSPEYRMNCVFNAECADSQYGNLSIRTDTFKRVYGHCCKVKGNLLTLIHGLEHRQPPTGGRLRGQEFKAAVAKLREIAAPSQSPAPESTATASTQVQTAIAETRAAVNIPLKRHPKEPARKLANLHEELIVEPSQMSPEAAMYVRSREWMTPDLMRKWGVGWIPGNGRSLFRKNYLVYTHRNVKGEVVSYSGRDLNFEKKWEKWLRSGKPEGQKPNKHRFVSGYHRGLELYGGRAERLTEDYVPESLKQYSLVVVEGMNDVLRMETLGVCAVGLCSNVATQQQIATLVNNTTSVSDCRIMLLPDCDPDGEAGFKELTWELASRRVKVHCGISSTILNGEFRGRQPESLTMSEWRALSTTATQRLHS